MLFCSGNRDLSTSGYEHLGFKLGEREGIYLYHEKKLIDCVYAADIPYGYSLGRNQLRGWFRISSPTPGSENNDGYLVQSAAPQILTPGGVYDNVSTIEVRADGPGTLYYTLDGSEPTRNSAVMTGSLFFDKTSVLKVRSYQEGMRMSKSATASYIVNENHTMPIASLVMDPEDFREINRNNWDETLRKQAHLEFYEEDGSFALDCGYSLFGGNARSYAKKSFVCRFDSRYGHGDLEYPVFDNRDNSIYDALVFRSGSSDWDGSIIRDILGTGLVDDYTDLDVLAWRPCVVYINGDYRGIFNIREKTGAQYIASHYNVDKDSVSIVRIDSDVTCGSSRFYSNLRSYCRNHDLREKDAYQYVSERVDLVNVADYWIAEGYVTNNDLLNVRVFYSDQIDEGKLKYIFYDLDYAWYNVDRDWYTVYIGKSGGMTNHNYENDLIYALLKNGDFRKLWLERLAYNLNNTWKTENVLARMEEIHEIYAPEIERDRKRWNLSMDSYEEALAKLRSFIEKRTAYYLRDTKSYFNLTNEEMKGLFGDLWKS